jgi:hypothetical protein
VLLKTLAKNKDTEITGKGKKKVPVAKEWGGEPRKRIKPHIIEWIIPTVLELVPFSSRSLLPNLDFWFIEFAKQSYSKILFFWVSEVAK